MLDNQVRREPRINTMIVVVLLVTLVLGILFGRLTAGGPERTPPACIHALNAANELLDNASAAFGAMDRDDPAALHASAEKTQTLAPQYRTAAAACRNA